MQHDDDVVKFLKRYQYLLLYLAVVSTIIVYLIVRGY